MDLDHLLERLSRREERRMDPDEALELLQDLDEMESDGGAEMDKVDIILTCDRTTIDFWSDVPESEISESESESRTKKRAKKRNKPGNQGTEPAGATGSTARERFHERVDKTGPTEEVRRSVSSRLDSFLCLLSVEMLEHIRACTVAEARRHPECQAWDLSLDELKAFIACLYTNMDRWDPWADPAEYKEIVPVERLKEITKFLRFDHREERAARLATDKFALVSQVWDGFVRNSAACYVPGRKITVEEQLYPLTFPCPFIQYMPNNGRDKLGLKFLLAADAESSYMVNGQPCLEKGDIYPPERAALCADVLRLLEPFVGKGRKVMVGRLFQSRSLTRQLMEKETAVTYIEGGVGFLSDITAEYPLPPPSSRWPVAVFCNILSLALNNAYVLYTQCTGRSERREKFKTKLASELHRDYMESQATRSPSQASRRQRGLPQRRRRRHR